MKSAVKKLPETSLENFYINRFGRKLYSMFFEGYTEKLWGRHPREISADWGSQRVKGLSIRAVLKDMLTPKSKKDAKKGETSLIEEFVYPKFGPGQLWEITAGEVRRLGGRILMEHPVTGFRTEGNRITAVTGSI
jgi:protoporphyrinogen oxidase